MTSPQYFTLAAALALGFGASWAQAPAGATAETFRLRERGGRAVLTAPDGHAMWLRALDRVRLMPAGTGPADLAPADLDRRSAAILQALRAERFNALGGGADPELWHRGLPYIQSLHLTRLLEGSQGGDVVDVYAPGFAGQVEEMAMDACAPRARDPSLIGYLSDDSLPWDPAIRAGAVLAFYLRLPPQAPGRQRAVDYLQDLYAGDIGRLDRRWGVKAKMFPDVQAPANPAGAARQAIDADAARFAADVLVRYLRTAANAVRSADPNHLFLGANLLFDPARPPAPGSAQAAAWNIADVDSVRIRPGQDAAAVLTALESVTPRPLLAQWLGCGTPPAARALDSARLVGFVWEPDGDWQSGRCAIAARGWADLHSSEP